MLISKQNIKKMTGYTYEELDVFLCKAPGTIDMYIISANSQLKEMFDKVKELTLKNKGKK